MSSALVHALSFNTSRTRFFYDIASISFKRLSFVGQRMKKGGSENEREKSEKETKKKKVKNSKKK